MPVHDNSNKPEMKKYVDILSEAKRIYRRVWHAAELEAAMFHIDTKLSPKDGGVLEVGSAYGGSLSCWGQLFTGPLISVDLPSASVLNYGVTVSISAEDLKYRNDTWRAAFGDRLHIVEGDSTHESSIEQVRKILNGRKVDFLFIDGDHSEKVSKLDFDNYSQFVRPGGWVGFHDVDHNLHRYECGKVFDELVGEKFKVLPTDYSHHDNINIGIYVVPENT